jgi:hypothetical protein
LLPTHHIKDLTTVQPLAPAVPRSDTLTPVRTAATITAADVCVNIAERGRP